MQSQQVHSIVGAGDEDGTPLGDLGAFELSAVGDLFAHSEGL